MDIGYQESVAEIVELIRDWTSLFRSVRCWWLHMPTWIMDRGLQLAKQLLKTQLAAHPKAAKLLETGDKLQTFAEIEAQNIFLDMPPVITDLPIDEAR